MLVPDVAARTGGIAMVSQSVCRLLGKKQSDGFVDVELLSLRPATDAKEASLIGEWLAGKWSHFGGNPIPFSAAAIKRSVEWADIVLAMHIGLGQLQAFSPRLRNQKWATFLHGTELWRPLPWLKRRVLRNSSCVANSQFTVDRCREFHSAPAQVTVCHLGVPEQVPPSTSADLPNLLGFSPKKSDIVIVGRMAKGEGMKGHRELFRAMALVTKDVPDARLIVVGEGDDWENHKAWASECGVASHVHFPGFLPVGALEALYAECGIFCLPGWQEGFGLVYLEAMRAGLACVATRADAAKEVIREGETGLLVEAKDPVPLAKALVRLLTEKGLREGLGRAGKSRFEQNFTEQHFHDRFWRYLSTLF